MDSIDSRCLHAWLSYSSVWRREGLRWAQEQPNQWVWTPTGGRNQIIERGEAGLSPEADRATRVTTGHAERMPLMFANIHADLAKVIRVSKKGREPDPAANLYPKATDGLRSMAAVHGAVDSASQNGCWVNASSPMYR